jgi:hypothetical protein
MGKPGKSRKDAPTTHHPGPQGTRPAHGHAKPNEHGHDTTKAPGIKGHPAPPTPAHHDHDHHHKANASHPQHAHHGHTKNNASQYSIASGVLIILSLLAYFM